MGSQYCGWFEKTNQPVLYPGGRNVVLKLTDYGKARIQQLQCAIDCRLSDFDRLPMAKKDACVKLGLYTMLGRAQFDTTCLAEEIPLWAQTLGIDADRGFLFSPYQTIHYTEADKILGISHAYADSSASHEQIAIADQATTSAVSRGPLNRLNRAPSRKSGNYAGDSDISEWIHSLLQTGASPETVAQQIFANVRYDTQETYYPFIAVLFSVFGLNCHASRAGINYERWDAIIVDAHCSIPIEIKSPTEEEYISIKAVRQALENKVVLLSRKAYRTDIHTVTMAVGYRPPNDRAEVARLIQDIHDTYGVRIAVLDLLSLLRMSVGVIAGTVQITLDSLKEMEGIVNVENS